MDGVGFHRRPPGWWGDGIIAGVDLGLSGRRCLITGASRGIGLATARGLCAEGARVLLLGRSEDALAVAAQDCAQAGAGAGATADWLALDLVEPDAGSRAVACCVEQLGGIDVLVNNAGTTANRSLDELTDQEWQAQWDLHVMAPMRLMRAATPRMAKAGWGRVVNVSSSSAKRPSGTNAAYGVTKAALLSLSRTFADVHAASGVLVNAVAPGPVATELWMADGGLADQAARASGVSREAALEAARSKIPLGRFAEAEEIASVIVFLCSERAGAVAGAAWSVDGGAVPVII
jgi:3-oxoacyl-[acyl-carrier protein] reductase